MPTHWSDTQLDMLRSDWRDPELSLSDMATHINLETGSDFSRNAIAGKANRLGLPLRRQPNSKHGQRAAPKPRKPSNRPVNLARIRRPKLNRPESADGPPHLHLTLQQLTDATCKFPRGEERFTFCGQSVQPDSPYCSFHHRLCYRPPETRAPNSIRRAA
jgi:GcrA cell cycle regulator